MKICNKCLKPVSLENFHKDNSKGDGYCTICKLCRKQYYNDANPESRREYRRAHYLKNRDKAIALSKKWHSENRGRWMLGRRLHRKRLRDAVLKKLGDECKHCGISDERVLQVDHVHGNGKADRALHCNGSAPSYLKKILLDKTGMYQLLCANCNLIKYRESIRHNPPGERV